MRSKNRREKQRDGKEKRHEDEIMTVITTMPTLADKVSMVKDILIVYKRSQYELYRDSPDKSTRDYLNRNNEQAAKLELSHRQNYATLDAVVDAFAKQAQKNQSAGGEPQKYQTKIMYRGDVSAQALRDTDIIVSVGGDGTVLDLAHLCKNIPILGVNSDLRNSVGFFCTANAQNIGEIVANLQAQPTTTLNTIQPYIDGRATPERAINDLLFAHNNPAGMTKYEITNPTVETRKNRKDSGLLVCTAAGSTAWMYNIGGDLMHLNDNRMQYRSRDLRNATSQYATTQLELISRIRDGVLTIDTQHIHYDVTLGQKITLAHGDPLYIVGDLHVKKEREKSS